MGKMVQRRNGTKAHCIRRSLGEGVTAQRRTVYDEVLAKV